MSNKYQTKLSRTCFFFKQQINTWNIKKNPGAQFNFGDCYNHTSIARTSIRRCVRKIKHREFSLLVASMRRWMEWQKLKREPSSVFFFSPIRSTRARLSKLCVRVNPGNYRLLGGSEENAKGNFTFPLLRHTYSTIDFFLPILLAHQFFFLGEGSMTTRRLLPTCPNSCAYSVRTRYIVAVYRLFLREATDECDGDESKNGGSKWADMTRANWAVPKRRRDLHRRARLHTHSTVYIHSSSRRYIGVYPSKRFRVFSGEEGNKLPRRRRRI